MGRGRISMELIKKVKARQTTFHKRKSGLMKKVYEFSTLCGVDVCLIIYAPNFEGEGFAEPETWPQDIGEVRRIIEKYRNTTSDRRPRIYDVQEYYKERMKKVEVEISKVRKEGRKQAYPSWDKSLDAFGDGELRMFGSMLDARLDVCNQKMNMLKGDIKEKATVEYEKLTPYLTPYPNSQFNYMHMPQPHLFPPPMNDQNSLPFWPNLQLGQSSHQPMNDQNSLPFWPDLQLGQSSHQPMNEQNSLPFWPDLQLGQSSQPSMLNYGQNRMTSWVNDAGAAPKFDIVKEGGVENNQNSYYNGKTQSYPMEAQNPPHAFHVNNGFYDGDTYRTHMFKYMQERK